MVTNTATAICSSTAIEIPVADGALPEWIQIMPMGENRTRNGTPPVVILADLAHAQQVVAASTAYLGSTDMVIDYDHQTVRAPAVAGKAEAAGWVKELQARRDGIWARPEWTAIASAEVAGKRYRYISPYFAYQAGGRVTKIINAGLTNTPNLDMVALASAFYPENDMDLKAIASALGLGDGADEAAILAAIAALNAGKTVLASTASALGAKDGDDLVALASATVAKAKAPDPALYVPVAVVSELRAEMSALSAKVDGAEADKKKAMLDAAAGKLPPSLRKHAESLDLTALASFLAAFPENGLGKEVLKGAKDAEDGALDEEELAIANAMGVSEKEYRAAKAAEEKRK